MQENREKYHRQTAAIRCGHRRTAEQEHNEPIFTTSSFVFESARQASDRFSEEEPGNVYSRFTNPTVAGFENRLAALEGALEAFKPLRCHRRKEKETWILGGAPARGNWCRPLRDYQGRAGVARTLLLMGTAGLPSR